MTESNETLIGLIRPDGTEKPEAAIMRAYAGVVKAFGGHLREPERPSIALITSQATQFSVLGDLQLEAQRNAVRALAYNQHLTLYAVAENQFAKLGTPKLAILPSPQALTEPAWQALLQYAKGGGNLLVTGPVDRDEHWRRIARASALGLEAAAEPLMFHNSNLSLGSRNVALSFDQQKQNLVDTLRFKDGKSLKELPYGKGRIFWTADPVELSEGTDAAAALYNYVAGRVGITPMFDSSVPLAPGILVFPTVLQDAVLYVLCSERADDTKIDLKDKLTGARLILQLGGQHAALALIGKQQKAVMAKYGF
jgi:hypothetical protein